LWGRHRSPQLGLRLTAPLAWPLAHLSRLGVGTDRLGRLSFQSISTAMRNFLSKGRLLSLHFIYPAPSKKVRDLSLFLFAPIFLKNFFKDYNIFKKNFTLFKNPDSL
jgi:hypothetical protein